MHKQVNRYNFSAIGQAIKQARIKQGLTREQVAEQVGIADRNLAQIENKGQHPRFQNFFGLVTMFNISVDEYFYTASEPSVSTMRRQVDKSLNGLSDRELAIIEATVQGIIKSRGMEED